MNERETDTATDAGRLHECISEYVRTFTGTILGVPHCLDYYYYLRQTEGRCLPFSLLPLSSSFRIHRCCIAFTTRAAAKQQPRSGGKKIANAIRNA